MRIKLAGFPGTVNWELPIKETLRSSRGKIDDSAGRVQQLITRITRKPVDFHD